MFDLAANLIASATKSMTSWRSPARWLEEWFYPRDGDIIMLRERLHYENLKSLTDKQLDVVRYLYMRLNIIDGKASYLLRINALTASVISLLISFSARSEGQSIFSRISGFQLIFLILALVFILLAFVLAFAIGELEYDRITDPPVFFNQAEADCYDPVSHHPNTLPDPRQRRFLGKYSSDEACTIVETIKSSAAVFRNIGEPLHTLKEYEDLFFKITIARVRILHWARVCVALAMVFSMVFVIDFAAHPPPALNIAMHPQPSPPSAIGSEALPGSQPPSVPLATTQTPGAIDVTPVLPGARGSMAPSGGTPASGSPVPARAPPPTLRGVDRVTPGAETSQGDAALTVAPPARVPVTPPTGTSEIKPP